MPLKDEILRILATRLETIADLPDQEYAAALSSFRTQVLDAEGVLPTEVDEGQAPSPPAGGDAQTLGLDFLASKFKTEWWFGYLVQRICP